MCLYRPFSNRKLNANQQRNAAMCFTMMSGGFFFLKTQCRTTRPPYDLPCAGGLCLPFITTFWVEEWCCYLHRLFDLLDHILPRDPEFLRSPFASSKNTIIINIDTRGGSVGVSEFWRQRGIDFSQPGFKCVSLKHTTARRT